MKQLYLTILLFLIAVPVSAGKLVKGHVLDEQEEPIIGANIYWEGTQQGTTSDADGYFELEGKENAKNLVVSYIGYTRSRTQASLCASCWLAKSLCRKS